MNTKEKLRLRHPIRATVFAVLCLVFLVSAVLFGYLGIWLNANYTDASFSAMIFTATNNLEGADTSVINTFFAAVAPYLCITFLLGIILLMAAAIHRLRRARVFRMPNFICMLLSLALFVGAVGWAGARIGVWSYLGDRFHSSTFYKDNYIDPGDRYTFPDKKRNLIYIYLESMETGLSAFPDTDGTTVNAIPNLTRLAKENVMFSSNSEGELGGFSTLTQTSWTLSAMMAASAGVTFNLPIGGNSMNTLELFMPGLTMLGDILEAEDYRQVFLCGSDASFAGRDHMLLQHGNYELIDYPVLHELGYCGERVAWGAYDVDLYACAKDTLLVLAQEDQPFNCTLLTVDTHAPDGFICPICANQYQDDYLNVYACADAQLMAFVQWVQQQSFYEDTTIVITGDHANMAGKFAAGGRQVYDCFINAMPVTDAGNYFDRLLTAVDIFPTTLAALGVQIEGDQLGIGVNLFSDAETLGERMGSCDALNNELNQSSRFYLDTFTRSDSSTKDAVTQSQHYIADRIKTLLDARNAHQEPTLAYRLQHASTFEEYLDILRESDYLVMFAVRDEASHHLSDSAMQKLAALGTNVFEDLGSRESCIAAVQNGEVLLEDKGYSLLLESFYIQDDIFTLLSAGWASGDHAQIFCPYARAVNARGINIVVYDTKTHMVVDSVCFDTYTEDNSITR